MKLPFNIHIIRRAVASFSPEDLRGEIAGLNNACLHYGAAFFDAGHDETCVIFAGGLEKFSMLTIARHLECNVVCFQDNHRFWYSGSALLPPISEISQLLASGVFGNTRLLFGQSSGGYAALYASKYMEEAVTLAVSPQTFADRDVKTSFLRPAHIAVNIVDDDVVDLRDHLDDGSSAAIRHILVSASEVQNPITDFYWMDHLHAFRMHGSAGVQIGLIQSSTHAAVHSNKAAFAETLRDLWYDPDGHMDHISRLISQPRDENRSVTL
ncbi:MAG: hypothetical protein PW791_09285 [Neorhizobium sp.]|nr:hypothetical protein [Neorhizobium sp.]